MPQRRRTQSSALATRLTAAGVVLGVAIAAAWPAAAPAGATTTATFLYTGSQQQFVVPAGVTSVHVLAVGGRGGNGLAPGGGLGGAPAEVSGDLEVFPGQTLYVEVGGVGIEAGTEAIARAFNGGDFAGMGAAGGGGASDVRLIIATRKRHTELPVLAAHRRSGRRRWRRAGPEGRPAARADKPEAKERPTRPAEASRGGAATEEAGGIGACAKRDCDGTLGSGHQGSVGGAGSAGRRRRRWAVRRRGRHSQRQKHRQRRRRRWLLPAAGGREYGDRGRECAPGPDQLRAAPTSERAAGRQSAPTGSIERLRAAAPDYRRRRLDHARAGPRGAGQP